ncbi:MAG TPA: hypothetical protein VFI73_12215 [Candidatus Nitrosopolaris sp.]|nr:hypothetical protein [Candidatus Nitrosopolaris sp.]
MNHRNMTQFFAIVAIVAAVATTAAAFATPQQALAYGHHNHHNHNSNSIRVSQDITQQNFCDHAVCANQADNSVDIHH